MITVFVYLCFILGLIELVKAPFRLYRFIKSEKKGGFLIGKFRNCNGKSSDSSGRTDRADSCGISNKSDSDDGNGDSYDRMPVIDIASDN